VDKLRFWYKIAALLATIFITGSIFADNAQYPEVWQSFSPALAGEQDTSYVPKVGDVFTGKEQGNNDTLFVCFDKRDAEVFIPVVSGIIYVSNLGIWAYSLHEEGRCVKQDRAMVIEKPVRINGRTMSFRHPISGSEKVIPIPAVLEGVITTTGEAVNMIFYINTMMLEDGRVGYGVWASTEPLPAEKGEVI